MTVIRIARVVLAFSVALMFSGNALAQDSTSGNSTTTGTGPTSQTSTGSTNVTPISPDQIAAVQQQKQQLDQQLTQQLATASPDEQVALINNYRQQVANLMASIEPPPPTPAQFAQQAAAQAAFVQNLPAADQEANALMQQRQQLDQQMATATPDQQLALIGQIRNLIAQQEALAAQQAGPLPSAAAIAQRQAAWVATLPPADQAVFQAMNERNEAIQAAQSLPPEQIAAAIQAILAQPLPIPATGSGASNTTSTSGATPSSN